MRTLPQVRRRHTLKKRRDLDGLHLAGLDINQVAPPRMVRLLPGTQRFHEGTCVMKLIRTSVIIGAAALLASTAFAQSDIAPRTTVSFVGGAGSTSSRTGVALGGSWLFDFNDRASMEAQGTYLDRGAGTDALSVTASVLVNLVSSRGRIVPYAALGGGLYRTSFELTNPAFLGPIGAEFGPGSVVCPAPGTGVGPGPGAGFGPGTGICPSNIAGYWGVGQMPHFYARRLGPMAVPAGDAWDDRHFTDPAMSVGGGLRFNVNQYLMIRPDVRALVVFANRDTHTLGVFGVQLGYRF